MGKYLYFDVLLGERFIHQFKVDKHIAVFPFADGYHIRRQALRNEIESRWPSLIGKDWHIGAISDHPL
jgi:hypothetical protein